MASSFLILILGMVDTTRSKSTKESSGWPAASDPESLNRGRREASLLLVSTERTIKNDNIGKGLKGVDIKSDGGYVILPEAEHMSGGRYNWITGGINSVMLPPDVANDLVRSAS